MPDEKDDKPNLEEAEVSYSDKNLEAVVRKALEKPEGPLFRRDLSGLVDLICVGKEIKDLSGLEQAHNLTSLNPSDNQLSDIGPLASLTKLIGLFLGYNMIGDISPLASLTKLRRLHLGDNLISDLRPLVSLTNLNSLYLRGNLISDIGPLGALTNLTFLGLSGNPLSGESFDIHVPNLRASGVHVQLL
jgi:Leucine-rich repeat (LRR) protein